MLTAQILSFVPFFGGGKLKTESIRYSGAYAAMGVDNSLRLEEFRNKFKVEVIKLTEDDMEFDMIGIDPALANAFRRILISEVLFPLAIRFHKEAWYN